MLKDDLRTVEIKWENAEDAATGRIHWKKLAALCTLHERNNDNDDYYDDDEDDDEEEFLILPNKHPCWYRSAKFRLILQVELY